MIQFKPSKIQKKIKLGKRYLVIFSVFLTAILLVFFVYEDFIQHKSQVTKNSIQSSNSPVKKNQLAKKDNPPLSQNVASQNPEINNSPSIDNYLKSLNFNGTALVVKNGKIILDKGYGYNNLEKKIPNNASTAYLIGSISKVFISTTIMQLQEQGKLHISDTISKFIPGFPNGNKITLYNLLTHTSGLSEHSETSTIISHDDLIKKIEKNSFKFPPGTGWYYSDSNYSILAYIAEKVLNEPIQTYVKKHIFDVAKMNHTGFGNSYFQESYSSKGYKFKNNVLISPSVPDMSQLFGCGDIYTTPFDMYLFDRALYNGKLLSKQSLQQFFTPFKHNYAFGIYKDPGSYSDHGVLPGWNVENSFSLTGNKYVILFSNIENGIKSLGVVNNQIYEMLFNVQ